MPPSAVTLAEVKFFAVASPALKASIILASEVIAPESACTYLPYVPFPVCSTIQAFPPGFTVS